MSEEQKSSDLQDLIATTTIRAFQHGQREERRSIANLIEHYTVKTCTDGKCCCVSNESIIQLLRSGLDG